MTVYVIIPQDGSTKLASRIQKDFPDDSYQLPSGEWLVSADGTTSKKLAEDLGVIAKETESAIVFATSGYYGRANTAIWEWLKAKIERSSDG